MILCARPQAQYLAYKDAIDSAIAHVLEEGFYVLGKQVHLFEEELAKSLQVAHAVSVGNATEALYLSLRACGIGPGDEVITVSHTAIATVSAIALTGAVPVLVDIDPETFNIDPLGLEKALSTKTKAVIAVHLYGQPAEMTVLLSFARKHGIILIEDCAQAQGAMYQGKPVGSMGDIGCFSFYPTKNLGAMGDGGAVVTHNAQLAERIRRLREYGWDKNRVSIEPGCNSRLDEMQAAILRVKLPFLDKDNDRRRDLARQYHKQLSGVADVILPRETPNTRHVYHLYVIRSSKRDALKEFLSSHGIMAMIHYAQPVHLQPAFKTKARVVGDLARTEKLAKEILSLPMYPQLSSQECGDTVSRIKEFFV